MPPRGPALVADAAALAAGVTVREVAELGEFEAVCRLFDEIWRPEPQNPPITAELLRALTKADNYVGGAFEGDELVGACVGFFGPPAEATMHSHIAGVAAPAMRPQRRVRAQAAPARLGAAPGRGHDLVDVRPAGQPQRVLQPGQARRAAGRSTWPTSTAA